MRSDSPRHKPYYAALTGLRAVAAYLVFGFHFNPFATAAAANGGRLFTMASAVTSQGHIGVTIFFVLSGFLITARYQARQPWTGQDLRGYWLNRFARIYPLYFLLTAATFAAMVGHLLTWYTWPEKASLLDKAVAVATNLTLTRALFASLQYTGVPTAWTLTVEECFYALVPWLLPITQGQLRRLVWAAAGLLLTGVVLSYAAGHWHLYAGFLHPYRFVLSATIFGRCVEFLAGMGLALWRRQRGAATGRHTTAAGLLVIAACVAGMMAAAWATPPLAGGEQPLGGVLINNFVLPAGIVLLLHGLTSERTWLQRLLATRVFQLLGRSSYAFYLVHLGLLSDLLQKAIGLHIALFFVLFNVLAVLLYMWVERPAQAYLVRRWGSVS